MFFPVRTLIITGAATVNNGVDEERLRNRVKIERRVILIDPRHCRCLVLSSCFFTFR